MPCSRSGTLTYFTQCDTLVIIQPDRCTSRIPYITTTSQPEIRHSKGRFIPTKNEAMLLRNIAETGLWLLQDHVLR